MEYFVLREFDPVFCLYFLIEPGCVCIGKLKDLWLEGKINTLPQNHWPCLSSLLLREQKEDFSAFVNYCLASLISLGSFQATQALASPGSL